MSLQCTALSLLPFSQSVNANDNVSKSSLSFDKLRFTSIRSPFQATSLRKSSVGASKIEQLLDCDDDDGKKGREKSSKDDELDDVFEMDEDERREFRKKIRQVIEMNPLVEEEVDPEEKRRKMQKLLADYPLVVEEDDPDWPEDADGWGFNFGQFFDKISVKNVKKEDEDHDSENEVVWQDVRPIEDVTSAEWEETVFKDISPLVILVHNRYKRSVFIV